MNHFTEALGLSRFTLYMQDYGGPGWFSHGLASSGPDRGSHRPGRGGAQRRSGANWETRRAFWADRAANESALRTKSLVAGNDADAPCRERSQRGTL